MTDFVAERAMQAQPTFGKRGAAAPRAMAPKGAAAVVSGDAAAPAAEFSSAAAIASVNESDMRLAIGRNWDRYRPLWLNLDGGFPEASFARAGFFFGEMWLLYRKQYAAFFIALLAQMSIAYVAPGDARWLNFTINVLIAFTGKWWITRSAALMVARTRSLGLSESETEVRIERQGGVSLVGPLVMLVFAVALGVAFGLSRATLHH